MTGAVALVGGCEHTPGCERTDRALLRISGITRPEVAVILAASPQRRQDHKRAEAQRWWAGLGARARCAFAGEDDPVGRSGELLSQADLIVVTGGRPWLLRRRLTETPLGMLLRERWRAGVPVMGSSAGAMALAGHAWSLQPTTPLTPCTGLAFVPGTLVAPHAGRHGINFWAAVTQAMHPELEVIGIPDRTALIVQPDGERWIIGTGQPITYPRHGAAVPGWTAATR